MQEVGAGDAHFGGFIAMFLNAPKCVRFERSLGFARIVAARHVSGLQPTDWRGLSALEQDK
jgi:sugar/nucleoside kinase (ribokinase family)